MNEQRWRRALLALCTGFSLQGYCLAAPFDPMPHYPAQGTATAANPPAFSWPMAGSGPFRLELAGPDGRVATHAAVRNWLTFDQALPPGEYRWRVLGAGTGGTESWFKFAVGAEAVAFPIPRPDALLDRARSKPRPRTLDVGKLRANAAGAAYAAIARQVLQSSRLALPAEPVVGKALLAGAADAARLSENRQLVFGEENRILAAALAWLANGDTLALAEARRRALNLAAMNPRGMTGFAMHDQAGRSVAWTLALAFDWLHTEWSPQERRSLLDAVAPRLEDMLGKGPYGLDRSLRLDINPYDSHGVTALSRSAVICAALAGEEGIYDRCFRDVVPRYLAWPMPWGHDDGGFANGTAYAQWSVLDTQLPVWDLLGEALGVDLARHPWAQNHGRYLAYFLPPGAPTGLFGDDAEKNYRVVWATQAKAYAARLPSPLADWYARQQFDESATHIALLLAPRRDFSQVPGLLPPGTPHALHIPSIGWVAMHSDLGDRARTSVYFKSSPYGSYNHSHADQNGFVVHARGRALAIDSGYYDYYGSPHWKDWYKQTRAHNAITFDGGQGQLHDTMAAKGKITHFEHHAGYDIATGDAAAAYGGALSRAVRSLVYVRPDALLVFDALASEPPRTWEWNLHALSQMKEQGERAIEIEQDGVRLCATLLEAPEGAFVQTDRFTAEPQGKLPRQWHARYTSRSKTTKVIFVALLDVECRRPEVSLYREGSRRVVSLAGQRFVFEESGQAGVAP